MSSAKENPAISTILLGTLGLGALAFFVFSGSASAETARIIAAYPKSAPIAGRLVSFAEKIGAKPAWLANVIDFESGHTWNPAIRNPSGATGIIQFIESTAKGLGTSTSALAQMSLAEQWNYVEKYFLSTFAATGKPKSQLDVFMAVYYPKAIGKSPNWIIGSDRDPSYVAKVQAQNPGIKTPADYAKLALRYAKLSA